MGRQGVVYTCVQILSFSPCVSSPPLCGGCVLMGDSYGFSSLFVVRARWLCGDVMVPWPGLLLCDGGVCVGLESFLLLTKKIILWTLN